MLQFSMWVLLVLMFLAIPARFAIQMSKANKQPDKEQGWSCLVALITFLYGALQFLVILAAMRALDFV
jgi:hypothetical protein